jgi:hypothetical protein
MMDYHRPVDIHVPEPDGLAALQTYQQIYRWVGIRRGKLPNSVGEPIVVF